MATNTHGFVLPTQDEIACERIMPKAFAAGMALAHYYNAGGEAALSKSELRASEWGRQAKRKATACRKEIMQALAQAYMQGCADARAKVGTA